MGVNTKGRTEEEDVPYEEEAQAICWKGTERLDGFEQMLGMRKCQESAFVVPILRAR